MHTEGAFLSQIYISYITLFTTLVMEQMGPLYFVNHPEFPQIKAFNLSLEDSILLYI